MKEQMMKKKLLCCALLGAMGIAPAFAQDYDDGFYDDRWYIHASTGLTWLDSERDLHDDHQLIFGFGRMFGPDWALDFDVNYINPEHNGNSLHWSMYGVGASGRYFFRDPGDTWRPYVKVGAGALRHEDDNPNPLGGRPIERSGTNLYADLGFGAQADYGRYAMRLEAGPRWDFDDDAASDEEYFVDFIASVGVVVKLGPEPSRPAPPVEAVEPAPAPVTTCADLDDDGDGVNNCDDRCPNSEAGQAIGPDGCPVPVTIDLRGVNFDFDKDTLRPDAVATLNEAVEVLRKYPDLRVEVAGHTDAIGTDQYNQGLSERRARAVYEFLTSNGIDAGRLVGPVGFGESRPIAPNTNPDGSDNPEGRAQNRRTELNVQN
jgi:OOP family OmpA-OmpF porin